MDDFIFGASYLEVLNWVFSEIIEPELNYFTEELLTKEEISLTEEMSFKNYLSYLNNNFDKEDTFKINRFYRIYETLHKCINSNLKTAG